MFIQSLAKKLLTYNDDHAKWTSKQSELLEAKRTLEESLELAAGEPSKRPTRDDVASKVIADRIAAAKVEEERRRAEKLKELELLREERANAAIAEVRSQRESFETFMALVNSDEATRLLISSVRQDGDTLIVTVENLWHIRAYQIRLQDAQALWDIWARLRHPKNPDKARLKLVDGRGNEVGGSRVWAGSLIWVSD